MSATPEDPVMPEAMTRRKGEKPHMYRGFILYAMQAPTSRSKRAVAKAMCRSEAGIRYWQTKHAWEERLEAVGSASQTYAARYYRHKWFSRFAMREVGVVEDRMEVSFHAAEPPPEKDPVVQTGEPDPQWEKRPRAGEKAAAAQALDDDQTRRMTRRHLSLLDALIGKAAKRVVAMGKDAGKLEIRTTGELIRALKARAELAELLGDIVPPAAAINAPQVEETYRVRKAQAEGGDVLEARLQDAEEAQALLQGMIAARGVQEAQESAQGAQEEASAK